MSDDKSARQAARRLFKRVSYQDGPLGSYQLSSLLSETYEILKIPFKPTQNDLKFYEQVLDADKDGKVTLKDLESKAVEYLCSNTLVSSISAGTNIQPTYKKFELDSKPQYSSVGDFSNYSQSQYSESNQVSNYKPAAQTSKYSYATQNDQGSYNYNYKSSFQTKPDVSQGNLNNYGSQTLYSLQKNSTYSKSGYDSIPQQGSQSSFQYKNYGQVSGTDYNGSSYVNQSYAVEQETYKAPQTQNYQHEQQQQQQNYHEYEGEEQERPYSQTVRQYLSYVGQVFMAYADPVEYTVTEADVPGLLRDTYEVLGREGYNPSKEDVQTWMKLCDVNQDGKVQFQQYEYFVVKSLERSGLNLYDD